jgi:hypothetical protein
MTDAGLMGKASIHWDHLDTTDSTGELGMRRSRERRRDGLRCLRVELRETEIDALIRKGMLESETRNDTNAVIRALYAFFDRTLGSAP